jgi:hypothetical protein
MHRQDALKIAVGLLKVRFPVTGYAAVFICIKKIHRIVQDMRTSCVIRPSMELTCGGTQQNGGREVNLKYHIGRSHSVASAVTQQSMHSILKRSESLKARQTGSLTKLHLALHLIQIFREAILEDISCEFQVLGNVA